MSGDGIPTQASFYDPERVGTLFAPDIAGAVLAGRALGIPPADRDQRRVLLLLVDAQVDFIHPQGSLCVPGAVEDTRRTVEWLIRNVGQVSTVAASLDSHVPIQIFFPTWWVNTYGEHPPPFTAISSDDVASDRWRPVYEHEWSRRYVELLERQAKKQLMIWPYHTLMGTQGHNLMPALYEALAFHTAARRSQPVFLAKGAIPKTEHYSILEPEVKVPEEPLGVLNTSFLEMLSSYQEIYVAGQARSHCVLETVASIMRHFEGSPDTIAKFRLLDDCCSSVVHPEIDFELLTERELESFEARGLRRVTTADAIGARSARAG